MRIACVLGNGFEESEFRVPFDGFKKAGHDVSVIGTKKGETIPGKHCPPTEKVQADFGIDNVSPDEFDALFIPGGYSPDFLRGDDRFIRFVQAFRDKAIVAVCHGPQLLLSAGLVKGKTLTAWKTVQADLKLAGCNVVDREVVRDGNLVTSRKPDDLPAFVRESLRLFEELGEKGAGAPLTH